MPVQFAPFKSFLDSSFFLELSHKKLNEWKLSDEPVNITASYSTPQKDDVMPSITLNKSSFSTVPGGIGGLAAVATYHAHGTLTNVNTFETFKNLKKDDFINSKGQLLRQSILDGSIFDEPSRLVAFHILSFADLKKYIFNYWFAFPALAVAACDLTIVDKPAQLSSISDSLMLDLSAAAPSPFFILSGQDSILPFTAANLADLDPSTQIVGFVDSSTIPGVPSWQLRNLVYLLKHYVKTGSLTILAYRNTLGKSLWLSLNLDNTVIDIHNNKTTGWERASNGKLSPKTADIGKLISPVQLANQAVNLNLELMKWRLAPNLDLRSIQSSSCLLLGAGTLGSYIARGLLAWGISKISLVDSGTISYSNPVRQPLYNFDDYGKGKAEAAAEALRKIHPSVETAGYKLEIPMAGHPETANEANYNKLVELIKSHDIVFLLMDSRESRWLPTVICSALSKMVINVALGFDSFVAMRHGVRDSSSPDATPQLGCYFCNDIVAPVDSVSNQTLDQMCTVSRPGVSMLASSLAVELMASVLQHPLKALAPVATKFETALSTVPHQLRGFMHNYEIIKIEGVAYVCCSACSDPVVSRWREAGWAFVKQALEEKSYIEDLCGLAEIRRQTEALDLNWAEDDEADDFD